jgi:hypothetical protein
VKFKRTSEAPPRVTRRVLRREVEWRTKYQLEGSRDQDWRECLVLDVSRGGAGLVLYDTTVDEARTYRVVLAVEVPRATLRLRGEVRHASPTDDGGLRVGVQFAGLSVLERDMLESLLDRERSEPVSPRS